MQCLVTGGGGFLGRYIVEQLLSRGDQVRILARGNYPELAKAGVEILKGDVRDPLQVIHACKQIEAVFHVAAVPGIWGSWDHYYSINTTGTLNIINACQKHAVPRLIYTSSPSVIFAGHPHVSADVTLPYPQKYLCHYPHTKALAEQAVIKANSPHLSTCSLRPHLIWGPRDQHLIPRLIARARSGRLKRVGDGSNIVSMAYVENVAQAHLQAADLLTPASPVAGQAYFINELQPVNLWQWVNEILALANLPPVKSHISTNIAYTVGSLMETFYSLCNLKTEPLMTRFVALQLSQSHAYSTKKATQDFNYNPQINYQEAMSRLKSWLDNTTLPTP